MIVTLAAQGKRLVSHMLMGRMNRAGRPASWSTVMEAKERIRLAKPGPPRSRIPHQYWSRWAKVRSGPRML